MWNIHFWLKACSSVRHWDDADTYDYIQLSYFVKILSMSTCQCRVHGHFWLKACSGVRHRHDADGCDYTKLFRFLKIVCVVDVSVSCSCVCVRALETCTLIYKLAWPFILNCKWNFLKLLFYFWIYNLSLWEIYS